MLFFANNAMIWFIAAAAVPLLVHLFARTRPPSAPFSSLRFLRKIVSSTSRARKPKDWLLLFLRTLAVLLFALAVLQPLLISGDGSRSADSHHVVLLVDRSGSMAAGEGARTRFRRGADMGAELLASLRPASANVIWVDAEPDGVFPEMGPNIPFLVDALKRGEPAAEPGKLRSAYDQAIAQLAAVEGTKEIVLISDFQRSAWEDVELPVVPSVKVTSLAASNGDLDNLAVTALQAIPASPVIGQPVSIRCQVSNYSGSNHRVTLFAEIGGARQSITLDVPAEGSSESVFPVTFEREGQVALAAMIDEDLFSYDDSRYAVVKVSRAHKLVLVAQKDSPEAAVVERIAMALPWLECQLATDLASALADQSADYIFVTNWSGEMADELRARAEGGTAVICRPGDRITSEALAALLGGDWSEGQVYREEKSPQSPFSVQVVSEDHPVFSLFASGEFGSPADARFFQRVRLPAEGFDDLPYTVVLNYSDNIPALMVARADVPPVQLWNLPIDAEYHTWSGENFVPFFAEFLLNARGVTQSGNEGEFAPGMRVAWEPDERYHAESLTLQNDKGEETAVEMLTKGASLELVTRDAPGPGAYRWMSGDLAVNRAVVNFPTSESDLRVIAVDEINMGETVTAREIDTYTALREGVPIWMWLIGGVLLCLLIESIVARWAVAPIAESPISPRTANN